MATKVTLRKANAIQNTITEMMREVDVQTTISLNEFQDVDVALAEANKRMLDADLRRSDLLMSLYSIRSTVGVANASAGITSRLGHAAYIDKRIAQLEGLVAKGVVAEVTDVIKGKLEKIRNRPADSRASIYGRDDEVSTGVVTQAQVDSIRGIIQDLKKQKQQLNDEVLELNVKTEIEFTPDVEAVLTREKVI